MTTAPTADELKQNQADLRRLQKDQQLPPLMQLKLAFLQALLTKAPECQDIGDRLEASERESIEDMTHQTQQRLFTDIVRCLSGRDTVTYCRSQRSFLRREDKLFSWDKYYLDCDTNSLTLRLGRDSQGYSYKFQLQRLSLSKYYKKYKGRYVLAVDCEGTKSVIGFDQELTCRRVHRTLRELVEQKRQWLATKFDNLQFNQQLEADRMALPAHKVEQIMNSEQFQHLMMLQQKVKGVDLKDEEGFKLFRIMEGGRVLINQDGRVKAELILKGLTPSQAASCYVQMASWNPSIELLEITARPRTNCLMGRLRTKKYNMISFPREATLALTYFKPCGCQDKQPPNYSYLIIEDIPSEDKTEGGGVRMRLKQIVEFLPKKDDPDLLLMIVLTQANFKGYCTEADNLNMSLSLTQHLQKLIQFVNSCQLNNSLHGYFQTLPCVCGGMDSFDFLTDLSLPTEHGEHEEHEEQERSHQPSRLPLKTMAFDYEFNESRVLSTIEDIFNNLVNEEFLEIMKRHTHESYYLRHRFTPNDESFCTSRGENANFLGEGVRWRIDGDLMIFIDKEVLAAQKGIMKMILKQLSTNFMTGKSIMNMSLPVEIFDRRSMLEAIADSYGFLATYATKIVAATDPIEQIKYVICAFMFIHATCPGIGKPFNPILGETYQARFGDLFVYLEQTSHHPPISALLIKNDQIEMSANVEVSVDMGLNTLNSFLVNWLQLRVSSTGSEYLIKLPDVAMDGIVYGDRLYRVANRGFVLETKQNIFGEFSVGKDKKRVYECKPKLQLSDIAGGIFKVKQQFADKVKGRPKTKTFEGLKPDQIVETCSLLSGKWFGDISFDGVSYKSKKEGPYPMKPQRMKYLLPSDAVWREDLAHKIWKDNERSNREKERMENAQRNDRKLREKFSKMK